MGLEMALRSAAVALVFGVALGRGASALAAPSSAAGPVRFYVSPKGNDRWTGQKPEASSAGRDGPFATLERAQAAVRQALKQGRGASVLLRGGTYYLPRPLVFLPEDSGTPGAPVVYQAYGREKPVLSGGTRVFGWRRDAQGRWQVTLPGVAKGEWLFSQLFVNGGRRYRPRLPKQGYYFIADALPPSSRAQGQGYDRFRFTPGQLRASWHDLERVEVLGFQTWTMARLPIESVDEKESTVSFIGNTHGLEGYSSLPKGNRFLVENVREALTEPGEWYLDRESGVLTYIPKGGESPDTVEVIAPRLDRLVELKGDIAGRRWVSNLRFKGITFAHTNWNCPREGNAFAQAEANLPGVIRAEGATDCVLDGCRVTHIGTYAVDLGNGCKRWTISNCALTDLGAGGVKISGSTKAEETEALTSHNVVTDCLMAQGGRVHPAGVGVWIGNSPHNRVEHNDIHDFYYTGISCGWSWGYGPSVSNHNTLAYNHIHHLGQGVLSDMGGIYTLGLAPGTVLHHNLIHDVDSFSYGGWGIYPDEGSTDLLIENNVAYRTKSAPFHQHYGKNNLVRNNIWAFGTEAQIMRTRAEEHLSFTFERNIVYWREGPLLGSNWSGNNYRLDNNLYWNAAGKPITFAGMSLEEWQKKGQDQHSLIADPRFRDPDKGDFRLLPGSPADRIGFVSPDLSAVGPRNKLPLGPDVATPPAFPLTVPPS